MRKERGEMEERTVPFYSFLFSRKILFIRSAKFREDSRSRIKDYFIFLTHRSSLSCNKGFRKSISEITDSIMRTSFLPYLPS